MYIKTLAVAAACILTLHTGTLQAQDLKTVLTEHFAATGAEAQSKLQSFTTTGSLNQSGIDIPFKQIQMRPGKFRLEGTFQGLTFIQTYNGTEGWSLNPFGMSSEPEPIPADQLDDLKLQADMDGMLWNWESKGYEVSLDGTEDVEGTSCYKISIVTPDTSTFVQYIDAESYILIKSKSKTKMMGVDVESETYFSNYFVQDGIAIPGRVENRYNGMTGEVISITKVEYNLAYDDALFNKPGTN